MNPEQFIFWLKGYLADKSVAADVNIIKEELEKINFGGVTNFTPTIINPEPWKSTPWNPWPVWTSTSVGVDGIGVTTTTNDSDKTKTMLND